MLQGNDGGEEVREGERRMTKGICLKAGTFLDMGACVRLREDGRQERGDKDQ